MKEERILHDGEGEKKGSIGQQLCSVESHSLKWGRTEAALKFYLPAQEPGIKSGV